MASNLVISKPLPKSKFIPIPKSKFIPIPKSEFIPIPKSKFTPIPKPKSRQLESARLNKQATKKLEANIRLLKTNENKFE